MYRANYGHLIKGTNVSFPHHFIRGSKKFSKGVGSLGSDNVFFNHQRDLPRVAIGPILRKPIATCDIPVGGG